MAEINVDKINTEEIPRPPVVVDPPEGWATLASIDGNSWHEKAMVWEKRFGLPLLPLKYTYTAEGNIALASEYTEEDRAKDIERIKAQEEKSDGSSGTQS